MMIPPLCTRALAAAVLLILVAACSDGGPAAPQPTAGPDELTWLEENLHPLLHTGPAADHVDLEPLRSIVGNARIVALGESTHGTAEFFTTKHRIVEFLVEEMGFELFAMEAAWGESMAMDSWVKQGAGDPRELLHGLGYWVWNTAEVLDFVEWMRERNSVSTAEPVSFRGFDLVNQGAMDEVLRFLDVAAPERRFEVAVLYSCFRWFAIRSWTYRSAEATTRAECRAGVHAVRDLMVNEREAMIAASSPEAHAEALRAAEVVVQLEHASSQSPASARSLRDRYMAENAEWLLDRAGPEARMVVWAHNGHVRDVDGWMGSHLRARYGDDMVVIGFSFGSGEFSAVLPFGSGTLATAGVGPPRSDSYEHRFERASVPDFFVDLRPLRAGAPDHAEWLLGPARMRMIGAGYDPSTPDAYYDPETRLALDFDVIVHISRTTASRPLPARRR
jgi:erythromycin esterase